MIQDEQIDTYQYQYSLNGVCKILNLLTTPSKKPLPTFNETPIKTCIKYLKSQCQNIPKISQNLPQTWKLINTLYLINYLQSNLFANSICDSVADRKVIKVILGVQKAAVIGNFLENSGWKGNYLRKFVAELEAMEAEEVNLVVKERPAKLDLENLYFLSRLMLKPAGNNGLVQTPTNDQLYHRIVDALTKKPIKFSRQSIGILYANLLNSLYRNIGELSQSMQDAQSRIKHEKLKIAILYLRCLNHIQSAKIGKDTSKSKVKYVLKEDGLEVLTRYFDDLTMETSEAEKMYCKGLFKNQSDTIPERNPQSQDGSMNNGKQKNGIQEGEQLHIRIYEPF